MSNEHYPVDSGLLAISASRITLNSYLSSRKKGEGHQVLQVLLGYPVQWI